MSADLFGNVKKTLRSLQYNTFEEQWRQELAKLDTSKDPTDDSIVINDDETPKKRKTKIPSSIDDCIILSDNIAPRGRTRKKEITSFSEECIVLSDDEEPQSPITNKPPRTRHSKPNTEKNNISPKRNVAKGRDPKRGRKSGTSDFLDLIQQITNSGVRSIGRNNRRGQRGRGQRGNRRGDSKSNTSIEFDNMNNINEFGSLLNTALKDRILARGVSNRRGQRGRGPRCSERRQPSSNTSIESDNGDDTDELDIICSSVLNNSITSRGRNNRRSQRNRGQRGRARGRPSTASSSAFISIGNTDDYPDELEHVPIFKPKPKEVTSEKNDDVEILEQNKELSVKVHWKCVEIVKFNIRKYQKLTEIYKFFAKRENVSEDKLIFIYNNNILKPDDTPVSIGYSKATVIDAGIVSKSRNTTNNIKEKEEGGMKLKFQYKNSKKPLVIAVKEGETLSIAMIKCAEKLEVPLNQLKFEFDGDIISGKQTPKDLELEGGECIDVKLMK